MITAQADPPPLAATRSSVLITLARVVLLLVAAGALTAAGAIALEDPARDARQAEYVCPMHPEVTARRPGSCPVCSMALERPRALAAQLSGRAAPPGWLEINNVRQHKILDVVRVRALLFDQRELRAAAWVDADGSIQAVFYRDQADVIASGEPGSFSPTGSPSTSVAVRRSVAPALPWGRSMSRLRFERIAAPPPSEDALRAVKQAERSSLEPNQPGWLELKRKPRSVLAVPASALLQAPEGPYVLRSLGGFRFERRAIEIGETFLRQGFAVVLSGLQAQDRVVAKAAFFLDADRRLTERAGDDAQVVP
jgi:hypothetical protein